MLDAWAIIKSRQSRPEGGFGGWRLTPPGMGGYRLRVGTPHPSRLRRATCLPAGRSVRGSDRPPACHSTPRNPRGKAILSCCGGYTSSAPCGGTFSCAHPQCVPRGHLLRGAHWGALKGKANEDVSFDDISLANGWYADLLCQHLDIPVAFRDTFW